MTTSEYNEKNKELIQDSEIYARVRNEEEIIGMVKLDKFIFETPTRQDLLFNAVEWERCRGLIVNKIFKLFEYKKDYELVRNQYEMLWSKRKCWPQKGTGRSRISHRGSSLFIDGGKATGKRPRDLTIKIDDNALRCAIRSILATRYREVNYTMKFKNKGKFDII